MKKSFQDIVCPSSEKNKEKVSKALANGNSAMFYQILCNEAAAGRFTDYSKYQVAVTDYFLCNYSNFSSIGFSYINIIPLRSIVNLYRTNIVNGKYDYDFFHLALEMADGSKQYIGIYTRKAKDSMTAFSDIINQIITNKRLQNNNGRV